MNILSDDTLSRHNELLSMLQKVATASERVELERMRPFYLLRPSIQADGSHWCVLYGENLQVGVAGFGRTPEEAARNFDLAWLNSQTPNAERAKRYKDHE